MKKRKIKSSNALAKRPKKKKHELARKRKYKLERERVRTQDGRVGGMAVDNSEETQDYLIGGLS